MCNPQVSVRAVGELWVLKFMFMYLRQCFSKFMNFIRTFTQNILLWNAKREEKYLKLLFLWVDYFWVVFSLVWRPWTFSWLPSREFLLHRLIFFMIVGLFRAFNMEKRMSGGKLQFLVFFLFLSLGAKNFLQSFQGFSLIHIYYYGCLFGIRWKSIKYIHKERQNIWRWRKMKSETSGDYIFGAKRKKEWTEILMRKAFQENSKWSEKSRGRATSITKPKDCSLNFVELFFLNAWKRKCVINWSWL